MINSQTFRDYFFHGFTIEIFEFLGFLILYIVNDTLIPVIVRVDSIIDWKHDNTFLFPIVTDDECCFANAEHAKQ